MADPRAVLDVIRQRADNATDGPWSRHDYGSAAAQEPETIVVHTGKFDWTDLSDPVGTSAVAWMGTWDSQEDADAEFIAAARSDVPRLVAALTAAVDLHREEVSCGNPRHTNFDVGCPECLVVCGSCGEVYPCPTVRAITAARTPKENDS